MTTTTTSLTLNSAPIPDIPNLKPALDIFVDPPLPVPTLAQKLGIVKPPSPRLTLAEWSKIKSMSITREDWKKDCPICCEPIYNGTQALLSCSHTFHFNCLKAVESHTGKRCPLCRKEGYETVVTDEAKRMQGIDAAIKIQKTWRMWKDRKRYLEHRRKVPPSHPLLLKRFHEERLSAYNENLRRQEEQATYSLEAMMRSLDDQLEQSKKLFDRGKYTGRIAYDVLVEIGDEFARDASDDEENSYYGGSKVDGAGKDDDDDIEKMIRRLRCGVGPDGLDVDD
ncbi:RING finger protein 32 [Phlyctochytrium planicorne]|nr:RING finger protein 32 [Phlyctochytrium planicorne]